jgi:MFS family permease
MARRGTARLGPFGRWWESQSDRHFQIIAYSTIISAASLVWGFIFLFVLDGYSDPEVEHLVPWSWLAFAGGLAVAFLVAPEFHVYWGQRNTLEDILLLDSRPEILRRHKEAEDAADMLGKSYQARLMGLYKVHNVNIGKKYRVDPVSPILSADSIEGDEIEIQFPSEQSWWGTNDSVLANTLPGLHALRQQSVNRGLIAGSVTATLLLTANLLGLFTSPSGERDHTLDLTASIYDLSRVYEPSPHYDVISLLFIALLAGLLLSTRPRTGSGDEEE